MTLLFSDPGGLKLTPVLRSWWVVGMNPRGSPISSGFRPWCRARIEMGQSR